MTACYCCGAQASRLVRGRVGVKVVDSSLALGLGVGLELVRFDALLGSLLSLERACLASVCPTHTRTVPLWLYQRRPSSPLHVDPSPNPNSNPNPNPNPKNPSSNPNHNPYPTRCARVRVSSLLQSGHRRCGQSPPRTPRQFPPRPLRVRHPPRKGAAALPLPLRCTRVYSSSPNLRAMPSTGRQRRLEAVVAAWTQGAALK